MIAAQVLTNTQAISVPFQKTAPAEVFYPVNNPRRIAVLAIGALSAGALAILVLVIPIAPGCLPAGAAWQRCRSVAISIIDMRISINSLL
jgi:hypothetical protein